MNPCDICSCTDHEIKWHVNGYAILCCKQCGLISANVSAAQIANAYEADYYRLIYPDYESDRNIHDLNNAKLLDQIEKTHASGSLIEIGSAFGFFLDAATRRGWDTLGFESSRYASSVAREKYHQKITTEDFLTAKIGVPADVVCMFDTIEHLLRPSQYIEKIADTLKEGGCLFITTGDISSLIARITGKRWRMVAPPLHVYYYSRQTVTKLLERYGFQIISIRHESKFQNINSMLQYQFGISKRRLPKIPVPLNFGDIMSVKAIK